MRRSSSAQASAAALNRYRNMDRDWQELEHLATAKIQQPALFIAGEQDPVLRFASAGRHGDVRSNVRKELIEDCGHWTQQEKPEEVNRILLDFLNGLK